MGDSCSNVYSFIVIDRQIVAQTASINLRWKSPWLVFLLLLSPKPGVKAVFVLMLDDWMVGCVNTHERSVEISSGDTEIVTTLQRPVSYWNFGFNFPTLFPEIFNSSGSVLREDIHKAKLVWLVAVDPSETDHGEGFKSSSHTDSGNHFPHRWLHSPVPWAWQPLAIIAKVPIQLITSSWPARLQWTAIQMNDVLSGKPRWTHTFCVTET